MAKAEVVLAAHLTEALYGSAAFAEARAASNAGVHPSTVRRWKSEAAGASDPKDLVIALYPEKDPPVLYLPRACMLLDRRSA
jgi:hypothetical protein